MYPISEHKESDAVFSLHKGDAEREGKTVSKIGMGFLRAAGCLLCNPGIGKIPVSNAPSKNKGEIDAAWSYCQWPSIREQGQAVCSSIWKMRGKSGDRICRGQYGYRVPDHGKW